MHTPTSSMSVVKSEMDLAPAATFFTSAASRAAAISIVSACVRLALSIAILQMERSRYELNCYGVDRIPTVMLEVSPASWTLSS